MRRSNPASFSPPPSASQPFQRKLGGPEREISFHVGGGTTFGSAGSFLTLMRGKVVLGTAVEEGSLPQSFCGYLLSHILHL